SERFLRLREGPVHDLPLPGLHTDPAGVAVRAQPFAVNHLARGLQLVGETAVALHHGLHFGPGRRRRVLVVGADEQYVLHGPSSHVDVAAPALGRHGHSSSTTSIGRSNRHEKGAMALYGWEGLRLDQPGDVRGTGTVAGLR